MLRVIERALWLLAAAALVTVALAAGEAWLYQSYYNWEFTQALSALPRAPASGIPAAVAARDAKVSQGQPLGRLDIPSINFSNMFLEGVDSSTLRRGVGHIPETAFPGAAGNVALSAHRDTFFRGLRKIRINDPIVVTTLRGTFHYVVESTAIVNSNETVVLRDIGRPTLTLITCYPFYYVGPAPKRFVVHAALVADTP